MKKLHPPPQFTSLRPRHATHMRPERNISFLYKKPTPKKRERRHRRGEGERGKKKKKEPGNSKSPQFSPETPRKRVREKNICQKILRHLDRSLMLLAVDSFVFPSIGRSRFCVPFRNINLILAERFHLFSTASYRLASTPMPAPINSP